MPKRSRPALFVAKVGFILLSGVVLALVGAAALERIPLFAQGAEAGPPPRAANPLIGIWMMHDPKLGVNCSYQYSADTMQSECENAGQVTPVTYSIKGATATVSYGDKVDVLTMVSPDEFVGAVPTDPSVHATRYRCLKDDVDLCAAEFSSRQPAAADTLLAQAQATPSTPEAADASAAPVAAPRRPAPKNFPMAAVALMPAQPTPSAQAETSAPPASEQAP